jgi:hypothetical protein
VNLYNTFNQSLQDYLPLASFVKWLSNEQGQDHLPSEKVIVALVEKLALQAVKFCLLAGRGKSVGNLRKIVSTLSSFNLALSHDY